MNVRSSAAAKHALLVLCGGHGACAGIPGSASLNLQISEVGLTREMFVMRPALEGSGYSPPCATGFMRW